MNWISVKERLPSVSTIEDVLTKRGQSDMVLVWEKGSPYFGYYYTNSQLWSLIGRMGRLKVTHWAEIEPPQ